VQAGISEDTAMTNTEVPPVGEYAEKARAWVVANLEPRAADLDVGEFRPVEYYTPEVVARNRALQRKIFDAGYAGISIQEEYGGQGLTPEHANAFLDAASGYALPDFGTSTITTWRMCVPNLMANAAPGLLRFIIPRVLRGEALICQFLSEPSSGSDLAGARTRAIRDGDDWIISGQKTWSTYAQVADWGLCLTRTNWEVPKHRGLTWFLVPVRDEAVTIRPIRQITGQASYCDSFFDNLRIPDLYRMGEVDRGWEVTQKWLVIERGAAQAASVNLGVRKFYEQEKPEPGPFAPGAADLAVAVGRAGDPQVRQRVAKVHSIEYVRRALQWRISERSRLGQMSPGQAAYGKLFRGTYQPEMARLRVEIGGAEALTWEGDGPEIGSEHVFYFLDGRHASIAGGTSEVARNGISEQVLKMPREPAYDTNRPYREVVEAVSRGELLRPVYDD
jgi:alkylation response protein AidB-like acyl-CoA dehydrogenase